MVVTRDKIVLLGCACIGTYVAYRYWKKREYKAIDEGFEEVSKIDDSNERKILLLGLDGAGKTSVMNQVVAADAHPSLYKVPPAATNGFAVYRLKNGAFIYNMWEICGAADTRKHWGNFLQDTNLLIFMVDASDTTKLSLAVSTLKLLLGDQRMDNIPILVVANKQDATNALSPQRVKEVLDLQSISPHKHKVEVIGCQTRPLPEKELEMTEHSWYHPSIIELRKKIFSLAP